MAACLLGLLLAGCSRPVPPSPALTTTAPAASTAANGDKSADKAARRSRKGKDSQAPEDPALAYTNASTACRQQATKTTMGSILAIFTRLRPGAYDADYKACMKARGYEVSQ